MLRELSWAGASSRWGTAVMRAFSPGGGVVSSPEATVDHCRAKFSAQDKRGRIRQKAKLTTSIDRDVITVQASWWFPEMPMSEPSLGGVWESNANVLTNSDPETMDPACGCWHNRGFLVKVYRCDEAFPSEHIVPRVPIEDSIPPYIPPAERKLTPMGPVREDNYGPYGAEWGTCPDTPMEWAIH